MYVQCNLPSTTMTYFDSLMPVVYTSQSPVGNATSLPARSRSAASVSHGSSAGFTRAKVGPEPATVEPPFPPTFAGSATPPPSLLFSLCTNTRCVRSRQITTNCLKVVVMGNSRTMQTSCGFGRRPTSETWRELNVLILYLLAEHMVVANTKEINSCRSRTPPLSLNRCNHVCRDRLPQQGTKVHHVPTVSSY